jgi:hypothetical protein
MKNLTTILAFLLFSFSLFAQYDRSGILISTSLGFSKKQDFSQTIFFTSTNPNFSPPENILKTFSISPGISYVVNEKFMIGIGYFSSTFESSFTQSFITTNQNGVIVNQTSTNNTKNELSGPTLHLRFSQNIMSRLIFSLKFTYFNLKGVDNLNFVVPFSNPNFPNPNNNRTLNYNFGEARFSPSLHYFISQKFGCYIETVGLNLKFSDSRLPNKGMDYNFDLNPQTWRVGLFYYIPTTKAIE